MPLPSLTNAWGQSSVRTTLYLSLIHILRVARPAVLIGGTDVVDILFCLRRDGLTDHWLLTVSAEQEAGKQMRLVLIG